MLKRHTFIYLFAHGIPAVLGLLALIAYTHLISPHEYGIYVIGSTIGAFVSLGLFSWVRFSVTRYQSEIESADVRATAVVAYGGAFALLAIGLITIIAPFGAKIDVKLVAGAAFFALTSSAFEIAQELRRAQLDPTRFFTVSITRSVMGLGFGLAAIFIGLGGHGLFLAISVSYLLGVVLYIRSTWAPPIARFDPKLLARFVTYGAPFAASGLLFALCSSFDRLLVAYLLGELAAGQYGAAGDLARQTIFIVSMSVASAVFPLAFRSLGTSGPVAAYTHLCESAELFAAIVAPIALLLALSADAFSTAVIGVRYAEVMAQLVPILALARFLGAVSNFYVHLSFQLAHRSTLQMLNGAVILCASLALMMFMTPRFGLLGAAIASVLAEAIGLIVGIWLTKYSFRLPWVPRRLARVAVCLIVMTGAAWIERQANTGTGLLRLFAVLAAASTSYALCAFVLDVAGIRAYVFRTWPLIVTRWSRQPN